MGKVLLSVRDEAETINQDKYVKLMRDNGMGEKGEDPERVGLAQPGRLMLEYPCLA